MKIKKSDILFYFALICAFWFALSAGAWSYWACLVIAYPFGLAAFFIWLLQRHNDVRSKRYQFVAALLLLGIAHSVLVLLCLWLYE